MPAFRSCGRHRLLAGALALAVCFSPVAWAQNADEPGTVVTPAKAAESNLRPKPPAPSPAAAAPRAEPARAEAEAAPLTGYLCITNSCSTQKMLPMVSEADQAAAAEAIRAAVLDLATQIAARALVGNAVADADDEADIVLTSAVDDGETED